MELGESKQVEQKESQSSGNVAEFISTLFTSRTQVHIMHLQTKSYAAHKALDEYYNGVVDLADSIAEAYQGKYGIIKGYKESEYDEDISPIDYLKGIRDYVGQARYTAFKEEDTNLQNEIDNVVTLLDSTLYKLENLS